MKLIAAVLAHNEADRYLAEVLQNLATFCDTTVLVDDHSTDTTRQVAEQHACHVVPLPTQDASMWGKEAFARAFLWDTAVKECDSGDWIYFADADHITVGGDVLRAGMRSWVVNAWGLRLMDVWDPQRTLYRADGFWVGWKSPRPWMVCPGRVPEGWRPMWPPRGVHTGHIPANFPMQAGSMPPDVYIEHLGYSTPQDRQDRHDRYSLVRHQLEPHEWAHAASILDPA